MWEVTTRGGGAAAGAAPHKWLACGGAAGSAWAGHRAATPPSREEGQPAQQEGPHHHAQGHKRLNTQAEASVKVFIFLVHFPTEDHFINFSNILMISSCVGPLGHWPGQHKFHWQSYLVFFSPGRTPHRSSFMGALFSISRLPRAEKCTTLPRRATKVTTPATSLRSI